MDGDSPNTKGHDRLKISGRAVSVWLVIIVAEILHGILRAMSLVPFFGEFRSNQIGVFTGSAIILVVACVTIRWIGAIRRYELLLVGIIWLTLTVAFEWLFGWLVMGQSFERMAADYNLLKGGLMPVGLIFLALSPLIAAKLRRIA